VKDGFRVSNFEVLFATLRKGNYKNFLFRKPIFDINKPAI